LFEPAPREVLDTDTVPVVNEYSSIETAGKVPPVTVIASAVLDVLTVYQIDEKRVPEAV